MLAQAFQPGNIFPLLLLHLPYEGCRGTGEVVQLCEVCTCQRTIATNLFICLSMSASLRPETRLAAALLVAQLRRVEHVLFVDEHHSSVLSDAECS